MYGFTLTELRAPLLEVAPLQDEGPLQEEGPLQQRQRWKDGLDVPRGGSRSSFRGGALDADALCAWVSW